ATAGDRHEQQIVNRIDADARDISASEVLLAEGQLRILPGQNALRRDVAVVRTVKCQNRLIGSGQEDFVVYRINAHLARGPDTLDLSFISLNDAKRRFLSVGGATEREDRLSQRAGHGNFIVYRVE